MLNTDKINAQIVCTVEYTKIEKCERPYVADGEIGAVFKQVHGFLH